MTKPSVIRTAAVVALVLATPVLVASLLGPTTVSDPHPDYFMRPLHFPAALARVAEVGTLLVVVAAIPALLWSWRIEPPRHGWASVVVPLAVVGAILGLAYRTMTAAVIGANIGAGIMILLGTPIVVGLLVVALTSAWRRRRLGHV